MSYLFIKNRDKAYEYKENLRVLDILRDNAIALESPCNGKGTCGKCKVKILQGKINEPSEEELRHLSKEEVKEGIRLSCFVKPQGDITLELIENKAVNHKILTEGYMPALEVQPSVLKKAYKLTKPTLENNKSYEEILEEALQHPLNYSNISLLKTLPEAFNKGEATAVYIDNELRGIEVGDTEKYSYGVAIDIGTTTVVASLVDLRKGEEIASESDINPQKEYGLDVLSRIEFAKNNDKGLELLNKTIIHCINELIKKLCEKNKVKLENIYEITVAANATMMHFLLGVNTNSIGKSPYATVFSREKNIKARDLGINISPFGRVYCLPGVSSYIGADIVAGAVVSELKKTKKNILFIDIGTNGEIVLSKEGELCSCSCAAGPALEGMNISCGMRAAEGAIEGVSIDEKGINLNTIGDVEPIGICGSGILDSISEIARLKLIGKTGRLKKKEDIEQDPNIKALGKFLIEENNQRKIIISSCPKKIFITQGDIRQVQLAKGAILSGFYALLDLMEMDMENLDEVIIAGQFGKHLSIDSLIGVGIIPENLRDKVRYIGNSSKTGALMCLLSGSVRKAMEEVAESINYFELSTKEGYDRLFTKCLNFAN